MKLPIDFSVPKGVPDTQSPDVDQRLDSVLRTISELKADAPVPANPAEAASPAVEPTAAG